MRQNTTRKAKKWALANKKRVKKSRINDHTCGWPIIEGHIGFIIFCACMIRTVQHFSIRK